LGRRSGARSFQLGFGPDLAMLNTQVTMCNRGTTPGSTSRHVHRLDRRAHPIAPSDWLLPEPGNLFFSQVPNA
jgi:hypothetical protein